MKVLILNGSPKQERSNTLCMTQAFVSGMAEGERDIEVEYLPVHQMNISPCCGCFQCWGVTPGVCCIKDDMAAVIGKMVAADVIIWSFPLYYFGLPSQLKALMDRQLPMVLPYMVKGEAGDFGCGSHPPRYNRQGKRCVVISTCGFYTAEGNYEAVKAQFDRCEGKGKYTAIFCGQGETFRLPELQTRAEVYLSYVRAAGKEFLAGGIEENTKKGLSELLFPRDVYERETNAMWERMLHKE